MKSYEYIQQATLTILSQRGEHFVEDEIASLLMEHPCPDYRADVLGWLKWKWEAEGRFAHLTAAAFHAGVQAETDRFEV